MTFALNRISLVPFYVLHVYRLIDFYICGAKGIEFSLLKKKYVARTQIDADGKCELQMGMVLLICGWT